jgi:hypothetical protein
MKLLHQVFCETFKLVDSTVDEDFFPLLQDHAISKNLADYKAKLRKKICDLSQHKVTLTENKILEDKNKVLYLNLMHKLTINSFLDSDNILKKSLRFAYNAEGLVAPVNKLENYLRQSYIKQALETYHLKVDKIIANSLTVEGTKLTSTQLNKFKSALASELDYTNHHQQISKAMFNLLNGILADNQEIVLKYPRDLSNTIPGGHYHTIKLSALKNGDLAIAYLDSELNLRSVDEQLKIDMTLKVSKKTGSVTVLKNNSLFKLSDNASAKNYNDPLYLFKHIFLMHAGLEKENDLINILAGCARLPNFIKPNRELESTSILKTSESGLKTLYRTFYDGLDPNSYQVVQDFIREVK